MAFLVNSIKHINNLYPSFSNSYNELGGISLSSVFGWVWEGWVRLRQRELLTIPPTQWGCPRLKRGWRGKDSAEFQGQKSWHSLFGLVMEGCWGRSGRPSQPPLRADLWTGQCRWGLTSPAKVRVRGEFQSLMGLYRFKFGYLWKHGSKPGKHVFVESFSF